MKSIVTYSTRCRVIHHYGSSTNFELGEDSIEKLEVKMKKIADAMCGQDLAVTFEPITRTTEEVIESKGRFVQFVPKFPKNSLVYGKDCIDQRFYKPFKHRGSGR